MSDFTKQLAELEEKMAQKAKLDKQLPQLYEEQEELAQRVARLQEHEAYARAQLAQWEQGGIRTLFYQLTGKKQALADKARQKWQDIHDKLETATAEWQDVNERVEACEKMIYELDGSDRTYNALCQQKEAQVRASDSPIKQEIAQREARIEELKAWCEELKEIIQLGEDVIETARNMEESVESALKHSTQDLYLDMPGSFIDKREAIATAFSYNQALATRCQRFQDAIDNAQVIETATITLPSAFAYFCDLFLDDLVMEREIIKQLKESKMQITELKAAVWKETDKLRSQYAVVEAEQARVRQDMRRLINEA